MYIQGLHHNNEVNKFAIFQRFGSKPFSRYDSNGATSAYIAIKITEHHIATRLDSDCSHVCELGVMIGKSNIIGARCYQTWENLTPFINMYISMCNIKNSVILNKPYKNITELLIISRCNKLRGKHDKYYYPNSYKRVARPAYTVAMCRYNK